MNNTMSLISLSLLQLDGANYNRNAADIGLNVAEIFVISCSVDKDGGVFVRRVSIDANHWQPYMTALP